MLYDFAYIWMIFNEHILNYVSTCVNWDKIISSPDTIIDFGVKIDIFDFCYVCCLFAKNIYLTNDISKICFRQSAKCKMTAQTATDCHVFDKFWSSHCIYNQNLEFWAQTTFSFSLSNQFILQEVCSLYVQYIQYIQNIYIILSIQYIQYILLLDLILWVYSCHVSRTTFLPPAVNLYCLRRNT